MSTVPENQGPGGIPQVTKKPKRKRSRSKKAKANPAPDLDQLASLGKDVPPKAPELAEDAPSPSGTESSGKEIPPEASPPKGDVNEALKEAIKNAVDEAEKRLTEKFSGETAATSPHVLGNN